MNRFLIGAIVGLLAFLVLWKQNPDFMLAGEQVAGASPSGLLLKIMISLGLGILAWGLLFGWESVRNGGRELAAWAEKVGASIRNGVGSSAGGRAYPRQPAATTKATTVTEATTVGTPVYLTEDELLALKLYHSENWDLLQLKGNVDQQVRSALAGEKKPATRTRKTTTKNVKSTKSS